MSDDREESQYRMLHALSHSSLQESDENFKLHLQFPRTVERDKLPSLETLSHLEECSIQPAETFDGQEHKAKYQDLPTFGMSDSSKGVSDIGEENLQRSNKSNDRFIEHVEAVSQDSAIDIKHSQCINYQHGVCSSSPDLQSSECNVSAAPFSSLESPRNRRDQPCGLPLDTTASEFSMRSQNSLMLDQYAMAEANDSQPLPLVSFELQHIESQTNLESILPISVSISLLIFSNLMIVCI